MVHYSNGRRSALTGLRARDTLDFMKVRHTTTALLLMASLAACGGSYGGGGDGEENYGPTGPSNPAPPANTDSDSSGEGSWNY